MIETCWSAIPPAASSTPSTASTCFRTEAGKAGTDPSSVSIASLSVTTASVPSFDSVKIWSNERSIVSVST